MKENKKWFTLVELIVVITILAILGTVAFISLQSYAGIARNALRLDWISKISTIVETKKQAWISMLAFANSGQEVPNAQIWWTWTILWWDYQAGTINASVLEIKSKNFIDPTSGELFRIWVTTKKWGQYEVATAIEDWWNARSKISGNYEKREIETLNWSGLLGEKTFTLSNTVNINKLLEWDTISWPGIAIGTKVVRLSSNWLTIFLDTFLTADTNSIELGSEEVDGLITWTDWAIPVTDNSSTIPYNIFN